MSESKERIDLLLVEQGFFITREKAKSAIMAGLIYIDQEKQEKAGTRVPRSANITVKGALHPYVSRGGLKLEKALKYFSVNMEGRVMIDIGASTGGFTDCALQKGASLVYAVDVGYNQLDWAIRSHPQVKVMERTNFRYMSLQDLPGPQPDIAAVDVSFISLTLILPPLKSIITSDGHIIALIKPQFEAGRDKLGKSGVIKNHEIHCDVLLKILHFAKDLGLYLQGITFSPITGAEGNIEFLAYWLMEETNAGFAPDEFKQLVEQTVREAAASLTGGSA